MQDRHGAGTQLMRMPTEPRRFLALAALLLAAACSTPRQSRIASSSEGARALSVQLGALSSNSATPAETRARVARLGFSQQIRDGFAFVGELGLSSFDEPTRRSDTLAADVSALLRWDAFDIGRWRGFLEFGLGLMLSDREFPTGGTSLNGTRHVGAGLAYRVDEDLQVLLSVRQQHVSNGRGLVADNPSWDGLGAFVGFSWNMTPPDLEPPPVREWDSPKAQAWSLRSEVRAGDLGDETGRGALLAFDAQLAEPVFVQLRATTDRVAREDLVEVGVALYGRSRHGLIGVAFDRQELDVFRDDQVTIFGELHANDLVTVVATAGFERRNLSANRVLGGASLRLYPFDSLRFEAGIGYRSAAKDLEADAFDVPIGIELAPEFMRRLGLSLFAEDGLDDDQRIVGLRWILSSGRSTQSLRTRDRTHGPLRRRP